MGDECSEVIPVRGVLTCTEPKPNQQLVVQLLVAESYPFFIVFNVAGIQIHLKLSFCIILKLHLRCDCLTPFFINDRETKRYPFRAIQANHCHAKVVYLWSTPKIPDFICFIQSHLSITVRRDCKMLCSELPLLMTSPNRIIIISGECRALVLSDTQFSLRSLSFSSSNLIS